MVQLVSKFDRSADARSKLFQVRFVPAPYEVVNLLVAELASAHLAETELREWNPVTPTLYGQLLAGGRVGIVLQAGMRAHTPQLRPYPPDLSSPPMRYQLGGRLDRRCKN